VIKKSLGLVRPDALKAKYSRFFEVLFLCFNDVAWFGPKFYYPTKK